MEHKVTEGKSYLITAKGVTTVTDVESGYVLKSVPSNSQGVVVAISDKIEVSGECNIRPFDVDLLTRNHPAVYSRQPVSDWKAYMLKRAEMTGDQKNIDTVNRAIIGDALLQNRFNEDYLTLSDYESVTGETLASDFWAAYFEAVDTWVLNPNEVKEWVTTSATESTSPYFSTPASKPIVEFSVVNCVSNVSEYGAINITPDVSAIFLPNVVDAQRMIRGISAKKVLAVLPNAKRLYGMAIRADAELVIYAPLATNSETAIQRTTKNAKVIAPNTTSASFFAQYASEFNNKVDFPKCTNWYAFASGAIKYNQATNMESAKNAEAAFGSTAMSPENIAATLDTLPEGKSDGTSKISFSRADKTKLAPLMAVSPYKESVDAAVARGWTVQFD